MKILTRNVSFALIFASLITIAEPVNSQAAGSIGAGLLHASGVVDDIIEDAGNEANYVVFNLASQVKLLIESLRIAANDVLDQGFEKLDSSQQQIFDNIHSSIATLEIALKQPIEEARQTVEGIQQVLADVPFGDDEPTVLRSHPSVIGPSERDEIAFTIRGISLDDSDPELAFGENRATRIELKQQQAIFTIPASTFTSQSEKSKFVSGVIMLKIEDCWLGFLFCDDEPREFQIATLVLPQTLADVKIVYNTKNEEKVYIEKEFSKAFSKSTGDLTKFKCSTFNKGPHEAGYFIDEATLRVLGASGKAGHRQKLLTQSPAAFSVELCAKSQISKAKKKTGVMNVTYGWREYKMEEVVGPEINIDDKNKLFWSEAIQLNLPDDANALTVKLKYFDGTSTVFTGNYTDQYVEGNWNNATKQLVIRPQKIGSIKEIY